MALKPFWLQEKGTHSSQWREVSHFPFLWVPLSAPRPLLIIFEDCSGTPSRFFWSLGLRCALGIPDRMQDAQLNLSFTYNKYILSKTRIKYIMGYSYQKYSLFTWNANLTGCPVFLFAKSGNLNLLRSTQGAFLQELIGFHKKIKKTHWCLPSYRCKTGSIL